LAGNWLLVTAPTKIRAVCLQSEGLSFFDSLHLALAEASRQDVFLTTDDKLLKCANKIDLNIRVANPVVWFMDGSRAVPWSRVAPWRASPPAGGPAAPGRVGRCQPRKRGLIAFLLPTDRKRKQVS